MDAVTDSPPAAPLDPAAPADPRATSSPRVGAGPSATPSFDAVYDEYVDFVWRTMWRLGVAHASLEDAVQDAFLVVLRRLPDFEGRSTLRTWLFGIAIRVAKDHRRASRRRGPHDPLDDERLVDASADPRARTERAEALRVLAALLDELDDDKRAVFVMSEIEQMSVAEMAEALGANPNTLYSRLRVAREEFDRAVARYQRRTR